MNSFTVEIWDDEGAQCTLYTVCKEGAEHTETDKFFLKAHKNEKLKRYFQELATFITEIIGEQDGALDIYFRDEREAHGLPPKKTIKKEDVTFFHLDYPLRLYCLRISHEIVVLFNGDEKTSGAAQDGKTSMAFYEAQQFAKRILEGLLNDEFRFDQDEEIFLA
jgi:hypothetical protein